MPLDNALFLSSASIDAATLAASSVQGSLSAANVQSLEPDEVWRATGCTAEWLTFAFATPIVANTFMLVGHNLTAAATLRVRLAATAAAVTASPVIDTGAVSAWPASGKPALTDWPYWFSLVTTAAASALGFGRLDIADPTNPAGFVQVGRLMGGPGYGTYVDQTPSLDLQSPDMAGRTAFGRSIGETMGPAARVMGVPLTALDEDEMVQQLFELRRTLGLAKDFGFCLQQGATTRFHAYSMQARFAAGQAFTATPYWNDANNPVWQTTLQLEEVI